MMTGTMRIRSVTVPTVMSAFCTLYTVIKAYLHPFLTLFPAQNPAVPTGCTHPVGTNAEPWKYCKSRAGGVSKLYPLGAVYMTLYFKPIFHTNSKLYCSRARQNTVGTVGTVGTLVNMYSNFNG